MKIGFNIEAIAKLNNKSVLVKDDKQRLVTAEFRKDIKKLIDILKEEKHEIYIFAPTNQDLSIEEKRKIKKRINSKLNKLGIEAPNVAVVKADEMVDAVNRNYIGVMVENDYENVKQMNAFTDAICSADKEDINNLIKKIVDQINKNREPIMDEDKQATTSPSEDKLWQKKYCVGDYKWTKQFYSPYERIYKSNMDFLDEEFMDYFGKKITYDEFFKKVDELCSVLLANNIKKGVKVPLVLANTPESYITLTALMKAQATVVPIFPLATEKDMKEKLDNLEYNTIFISDICYDRVKNVLKDNDKMIVLPVSQSMPKLTKTAFELILKPKMGVGKISYNNNCVSLDDYIKNSPKYEGNIEQEYDKDYIVAQMYTGGTVKAKGVYLTNENFESAVHSYLNDIYNITRSDKFSAFLPFNHVFGLVIGTYMATCLGVKLDVIVKINFKKIDKLFLKDKVTIFGGVPTMFPAVINNEKLQKSKLSHVKYILSGGGAISPTQVKNNNEFFKERGSNAITIDGYGKTESSGGVIYNNIPIVNTDVKIVKVGTQEEVGYGEKGELCISGPSVMKGHVNETDNPHALQVHSDGKTWLHTDDAAYITKDGKIYITGRLDRTIKVNGECVWVEEMESELMKHPAVEGCAIVGKSDSIKGTVPVAFVVLKNGIVYNENIKQSIELFYEENMPYFARPTVTKIVEKLPLTALGKVDFKNLEIEAEMLEKPRVKICK